MKNKKGSVMVPILWIFATVMWTIAFTRNLEYRGLSDTLVILQGAAALLSLAAAIIAYIKTK